MTNDWGRLKFYAKEAAETDCPNTARDLTEAAACIREMVEKIDQLEAQIENIYFDLTED